MRFSQQQQTFTNVYYISDVISLWRIMSFNGDYQNQYYIFTFSRMNMFYLTLLKALISLK